jgi:hypothetical protein
MAEEPDGDVRRSEVAAVVMQNLVKVGAQTYVYDFTDSKPHEAGTEHNPRLRRYFLRIRLKRRALLIGFTDYSRSSALAIIISGGRQ